MQCFIDSQYLTKGMPQRELSTLVMTLCFSNLMNSESTKSRSAKGIGLGLQKIGNALSLIEFFHTCTYQ